MGIAGSGVTPYPVFRQALDAGQLERAMNIAAEMRTAGATVSLQDALRIVQLLAAADDPRYDRAAAKWFGRLSLEGRGVDRDVQRRAAAALEVLPERPEAMKALSAIAEQYG